MSIHTHFTIKEFVCDHVYDKLGEDAWRLFDARLLIVMSWLRQKLNRKITINNRSRGQTQRGLRCNQCLFVKDKTTLGVTYLSAHVMGAAVDFDVEGMLAEEVRAWLDKNKSKLPYPIRLEVGVGWVHLDVAVIADKPITYFMP